MTTHVRMLRSTGGPDGRSCLAGEVVDLPAGLAAQWIAQGRACVADVPEESVPVVQSRDPVPSVAPTPKKKHR